MHLLIVHFLVLGINMAKKQKRYDLDKLRERFNQISAKNPTYVIRLVSAGHEDPELDPESDTKSHRNIQQKYCNLQVCFTEPESGRKCLMEFGVSDEILEDKVFDLEDFLMDHIKDIIETYIESKSFKGLLRRGLDSE